LSLPDGFEYVPAFLGVATADDLLQALRDQLPWRQHPIRMFGRELLQPRLIAWCSDPAVSYCYSGTRLAAEPWHPQLLPLRERLQTELAVPFNSVLLNAYRNGQDAMGWHADDEPELGHQPCIASLSLGQARTMRLRRRGGGASIGCLLEHGSLLVMRGDSQTDWQHAIPRSRRQMQLRINLTFRHILRA
jgi:alkylated DNA repair dioxygenase AlkB